MLNLKRSIVTDFWKKTDPRMSKILSIMENVEHWVADDSEAVNNAICEMGKKLNGTSKKTLASITEELVFMMAYMGSSKFFRLLKWMDETHPGLSVHYIMEAKNLQEEWAPAKLMVDRVQTVNSLQLMGKVFAPSRTRLIDRLLKDEA